MKASRKRTLAFLLASIICLTLCQPLALAIVKEDGIAILESSDIKVVTVNKKKAFNLSPKDFSDAYNSLIWELADSEEDARWMLYGDVALMNEETHKSTKFNMNGSSLYFISTSNSLTKGKIRQIQVELFHDDESFGVVLATVLYMVHVYDEDVVTDVAAKVVDAVDSGKEKISFTKGKIKYTIENSDGVTWIYISPK